MDKMILDSLFCNYQNQQVLKGAYLEIELNKITCLIGKNGSGKSTLFKIAAGQLQAHSGLTIINHHRFHKTSQRKRFKHLSYLPQQSFLPKSIKVKNLVSHNILPQDDLLPDILDSRIGNLSTGERRYVEILFVLSLNRDFVLLDEPFTGLAPVLIEKVIDHLLQIKQKGTGILIADHYMRYVLGIGDMFYLLEHGQIKPTTAKSDRRTQ